MFLINLSSLQLGGITPKIIDFPNKEFKVVLEEIPHEESVAIVVQTDLDPTRMIFATAMLVEIVSKHNPKRIIVVHPWLSFSRQDRRLLPGEPQSLEMILSWYAAIGVTDIIAFDIHAVQYRVPGKHRWNEKLTIHNLNLAGVIFDPNLPVLSPTNEGEPFLNPISGKGIRITYLSKTKYCASCSMSKQTCTCGGDTIIRLIPDSPIPKGEIQIIDDTVAGGGTMLGAMNLARGAGATKIKIVTVHGFFNGKNAAEAASVADRIILSNTVTPKLNPDLMRKIEIFDVSKVITEYLSLILK